jgi:hypothetical protein
MSDGMWEVPPKKPYVSLLRKGRAFRVPAGVVGQAWRDGRVQVNLARFLRSEEVDIIPLDERTLRRRQLVGHHRRVSGDPLPGSDETP